MAEKQKRGFMDWYFKSNLLVRILIGLILGAIIGLIVGPKIAVIKPLGTLLINLLSMVVMPLVFFSISTGTASLSPATLGRVTIKILVYYVLTTVCAASIGLFLGHVFHPGLGLSLAKAGAKFEAAPPLSMTNALLDIVPKNPVASLAQGKVLPTIFFAIIFGIAIAYLKESKEEKIKHGAETVFNFLNGGFQAMILITKWILQYAPIGVFALIAVVLGTVGSKVVGPLAVMTLIIYFGYAIQMLLVYGGLARAFGLNIFKIYAKNTESMLAVFVTRSGAATLPMRMKEASEMGIPEGIYSFTLPLGAVINMDGGAIYMLISLIFIAQVSGMPLTFTQQMTAVLAATLGSIGAASIPGGSAIMLLMVLNAVGLNVATIPAVADGYAMILGIDAILDMGRSVVNCEGDLVATTIIAKSEGKIDLKKLYGNPKQRLQGS